MINYSNIFSPPQVLYVDKLPVGFRDLAQFRKLFSRIVNPPYCQVRHAAGVVFIFSVTEAD